MKNTSIELKDILTMIEMDRNEIEKAKAKLKNRNELPALEVACQELNLKTFYKELEFHLDLYNRYFA